MSRKPRSFALCEAECQELAHIVERGGDWQARQRARTLLLLYSGKPINTVAAEQGLHRDTVAVHRDTWLAKGIAGLFDAPRSGAPRKLQVEHVPVLCDWARQEALSAPQLKDKLRVTFSVQVSTWVVQQALSRKGFVWKRSTQSPCPARRVDAGFHG
jgi:transposase